MATIQFTIPNAELNRVVAALCAAAGVPASPANAKQAVIDYVRTAVRNVERSTATAGAIRSVETATWVDPGIGP